MNIMGLITLIKKQALHNLGKSWAICAFQVCELSITIPKNLTFRLLEVDFAANWTCLVLLKFKVNKFELSQSFSGVKIILTSFIYCLLL
jgi:hypothetical protein